MNMSNMTSREAISDSIISDMKLNELKELGKSFTTYNNRVIKGICQEIVKKIEWAEEQYKADRLAKDNQNIG